MNIKYVVLCSKNSLERRLNVEKLKEQLPDLHVVYCIPENVFSAFIASFYIEDEYDGLVLLEDDIQLCQDFKNKCESIIAQRPHEVISMFESACSKGELHSEYRNGRNFMWNQCNYYPREIGRIISDPKWLIPFMQWLDDKGEVWGYPSDTYVGYVLGKCKIKYWMEVPFLVQHLDMKSHFKGRPSNRQSKYFIDEMED